MKFDTVEQYAEHLQKNKIDCSTCKFACSVVGSSHHQSCNHPSIEELKPLLLLQLASGQGRTNPTRLTFNNFPVQEWDRVGVERGYVLFPVNFDPVWLEYCLMYGKKD